MTKNNPLNDADFLKKIDSYRQRIVYAKIVTLNFAEEPIQEIIGKVTSGSINVDGTSSVRRTCNISLVADEIDIDNYYWGLNTKFKVYIGLQNFVDPQYEDIIWFPQGIYLITSFSTSLDTSKYNINISGKDKMCLLNGDLGGVITSLTEDFGTIDEIDENGIKVNKKISIYNIILNMIHNYAQEPYSNIIINDLDKQGLELIEYRGEQPLYLIYCDDTNEVINMTLNGDVLVYPYDEDGKINKNKVIEIGKIEDEKYYDENGKQKYFYNTLSSFIREANEVNGNEASINEHSHFASMSEQDVSIVKVQYGQTVGYRDTELVYANDLIANVGESFTSVLDKIISMLGNFEYFYDVDGRFVFQEKQNGVQTYWNSIQGRNNDNERYVENRHNVSPYAYLFENGTLVSSYQNTPDLLNLKNDYTVWCARDNGNGVTVPVHLRYAIDQKPEYYKAFPATEFDPDSNTLKPILNKTKTKQIQYIYVSEDYSIDKNIWKKDSVGNQYIKKDSSNDTFIEILRQRDWRELIYQMSLDYLKYGMSDTTINYIDYLGDNIEDLLKGATYREKHSRTLYKDLTGYRLFKYSGGGIFKDSNTKISSWYNGEFYTYEELYYMGKSFLEKNLISNADAFGLNIKNNNANANMDFDKDYYYDGKTGYEMYYQDMKGFWRSLYDPEPQQQYKNIPFNKLNNYLNKDVYTKTSFIEYNIEKNKKIKTSQLYTYNNKNNIINKLVDYYSLEQIKSYLKSAENVLYDNIIYYKEDKTYHKTDASYWCDFILNNKKMTQLYVRKKDKGKYILLEDFILSLFLNDKNSTDKLYYYSSEPILVKQNETNNINKIYFNDNQFQHYYKSYMKNNCGENLQEYVKVTPQFLGGLPQEGYVYAILDDKITNGYKIFTNLTEFSFGHDYYVIKESDYKKATSEKTDKEIKSYIESITEKIKLKDIDSKIKQEIFYYNNGYYANYEIMNKNERNTQYYIKDKNSKYIKYSNEDFHFLPENKIYYYKDNDGLYQIYKDYIHYNSDINIYIKGHYEEYNKDKHIGYTDYYYSTDVYNYIKTNKTKFKKTTTYTYNKNSGEYVDKYNNKLIYKIDYKEVVVKTSEKDKTQYEASGHYFDAYGNKAKKISGKNSYYTEVELDYKIYVLVDRNTEKKSINEKAGTLSYYEGYYDYDLETYWIKTINTPNLLTFWFDFLDAGNAGNLKNSMNLAKYSVRAIGDRQQAINNQDIKAIYYRDIPNVIFVNNDEWESRMDNRGDFTFIKVNNNLNDLFHISSQGKSAKDILDEEIYKHSYCIETLTLNTIPIYHLSPNTRIYVNDSDSRLSGEYIVTRFNIPLTHSGMMNITAVKAVERLL